MSTQTQNNCLTDALQADIPFPNASQSYTVAMKVYPTRQLRSSKRCGLSLHCGCRCVSSLFLSIVDFQLLDYMSQRRIREPKWVTTHAQALLGNTEVEFLPLTPTQYEETR